MTWDAVRDRLADGANVILPIGAAAKQHGLHLPLNTDEIQADYFARCLSERTAALVWPVLTYGHYPAFVQYAGSLSVDDQTFQTLIITCLDQLISQSSGRVFVLNTGISTVAPVEHAIAMCGRRRCVHVPIYLGPHFRAEAVRLGREINGGHAGEIETSIMLAIAPDVVQLGRAVASPSGLTGNSPGALSPDDPSSLNYSPSGTIGDPARASRSIGLRFVAAILKDLAEI